MIAATVAIKLHAPISRVDEFKLGAIGEISYGNALRSACRKPYHALLWRASSAKKKIPLRERKDRHEDITTVGGWPRCRMVLARLRMSAVGAGSHDVPILSDGVFLAEEDK